MFKNYLYLICNCKNKLHKKNEWDSLLCRHKITLDKLTRNWNHSISDYESIYLSCLHVIFFFFFFFFLNAVFICEVNFLLFYQSVFVSFFFFFSWIISNQFQAFGNVCVNIYVQCITKVSTPLTFLQIFKYISSWWHNEK